MTDGTSGNQAFRRSCPEMTELVEALFSAAGLDAEKALRTAQMLVLTDLMGRFTHGLSQVDNYLKQIAAGQMTCTGVPDVIRDTGGTLVLDGNYRPGMWLVDRAIRTGLDRLGDHGVFTCAIRRSHHIGCLAALAKTASDAGCFVMLASSGPHSKFVAPFGGREPLFSPNPFAIGFPASNHPVLVDICASVTTVSMVRETVAAGQEFAHPWLLDPEGKPTRDPRYLETTTPRGSLVLLGGEDAGHKGFGLAMMVEALTQGLSGHGRRDAPTNWGASVYLQLIDPDAFAGTDSFVAQMDFLIESCHATTPVDAARPVRIPGEHACQGIEVGMKEGVPVPAATVAMLRGWAMKFGVDAAVLS